MKLTREQIVYTALRLLDEHGLEGLTLRKIATELGVQAPALYWHVKNKKQLLDEMATTIFDDAFEKLDVGAEPRADWRTEMQTVAHFLRNVMLAHRDGAKVLAGTFYTGEQGSALHPERHWEPLLREAGFQKRETTDLFMSIYHYVVGFVIEEQEVFPRPGERDPRYDIEQLAGRSDRDRDTVEYLFGADQVLERFHSGLRFILDGAEARIAR